MFKKCIEICKNRFKDKSNVEYCLINGRFHSGKYSKYKIQGKGFRSYMNADL